MSAVNWNNPVLTDTLANFLAGLKNRDENLGKMDFSSDSNIPTNFIKWSSSNTRFELYNGTSWVDLQTNITAHLANTSNPHSVTATQVGKDTAQWNANRVDGYTIDVVGSPATNQILSWDGSKFTNQTAATLGLATSSDLSSHTGNTSNPHSTTAAQVGAAAKANNLSDLTSASTARSNLGLGSLATLSSVGDSNFSGQLAVSHGGTGGSTAAAARSGLGAAASGANTDITSLSPAGSHLTLQAPSGFQTYLGTNATSCYVITTDGRIRGMNAGTRDLGYTGTGEYMNNLYFEGKLRHRTAQQTWSFFTYTTTLSLDPNAAIPALDLAKACAHAINTIVANLVNHGLFN